MSYLEDMAAANRRKEARTSVDDNVYVVIDTEPEIMGLMVEISSTGMAFTFVDLDTVSQRLSGRMDLKLDLFATGVGYFVKNLPARLVSTTDTSEDGICSLSIKRIGVEFVDPTLPQQVQINRLIKQQAARENLNIGSA